MRGAVTRICDKQLVSRMRRKLLVQVTTITMMSATMSEIRVLMATGEGNQVRSFELRMLQTTYICGHSQTHAYERKFDGTHATSCDAGNTVLNQQCDVNDSVPIPGESTCV